MRLMTSVYTRRCPTCWLTACFDCPHAASFKNSSKMCHLYPCMKRQRASCPCRHRNPPLPTVTLDLPFHLWPLKPDSWCTQPVQSLTSSPSCLLTLQTIPKTNHKCFLTASNEMSQQHLLQRWRLCQMRVGIPS